MRKAIKFLFKKTDLALEDNDGNTPLDLLL